MRYWYIVIAVIMVPLVSAGIDFTIKPAIESNAIASVVNPTADNGSAIDPGFLSIPVVAALPSTGGGGGGQVVEQKTSTLYYDVLLYLDKDKYKFQDTIHARMVIINKGYTADRDGILVSYLTDPNGTVYRQIIQNFELIEPTCNRGGRYNQYSDTCVFDNKSTYTPFKYAYERNVTLPFNPKLGEWNFTAKYTTYVQPTITSVVGFEVFTPIYNWWILLIIIIYIWYRYNEYKKERETGRWRRY